ncbi:hypothetical protein [Gimesia maris]|uniref:hypothetical protein n=1 Tax=Gimesia maris TaxID=122 RepID=UPI00241C3A24|nr:hypothetical protein [Gimesia maris]|tara:strand:- start:8317 stop:8760 length:444 start_codon:yes stop_codon:yes gene_type:complete
MFPVSRKNSVALFFCALTLTGCFGGSAEHIERAAVSGSVTYDGKPLPEGSIQFVPDVDAAGKPVRGKLAQALIKDGSYSLSVEEGPAVGNNKVLINAIRNTGKFEESDGQKTEIMQQYIPARYNTQTTLKYEVKAGENTADFTLEAK